MNPSPNICLSLSKTHKNIPSNLEILIVPSSGNWNDFGFKIRVDIGIIDSTKEIIWLPAYFAIKNEHNTKQFFKSLLKSPEGLFSIYDLKLPFATLLFETQQYSLMRKTLGSERSIQLLKAMNDVALLNFYNVNIDGWSELYESKVFNEAMTRASESYFAYRKGADVLINEQWFEQDTLNSFSVDLIGEGPKFKFDFNFDSANLLRGRIAVIVGKNGYGKTASLSKMAAALSGSAVKSANFSKKPNSNQILAFVHSGANAFTKKSKNHLSASVRTFTFDPRKGQIKDGFARLLVDITRTRDDGGYSFLSVLKPILNQEFGQLQIHVPIKDNINENCDYVDKRGKKYRSLSNWIIGGEQSKLQLAYDVDFARNLLYLDSDLKPRKLSTGQFSFLKFSLNALANAGPASIFLIDEPENFLHPNLISQFMRLLNRILCGTRSIAIIATHSPFVVREVQAKQVHVLYSDSNEVSTRVVQPRLQTLGANVGAISSEVFGDDLPKHLMEEILRAVSNTNTFEEILDQYGDEMSVEALMYIRNNRPND